MASTTGCATNGAPAGAPLTIGIVGFGNFGQFLGKEFVRQGHRVIGNSRRDYTKVANAIGCEYVTDAGVLMDAQPDVVVLCTSIMSLHSVMSKFPTERLAGVLVVDVLSVKMFARGLMREMLPADASILCTHPMFGPESGKDGWDGLPFVYDVVRVSEGLKPVCNAFLRIWEDAKCRMVPMSCEEHDQYAASTQFITHTTGRMLNELSVASTPINTAGYESLLGVVDTTTKDSFDLYYGLFKYNPKAHKELDKLEEALNNIRAQLKQAEDSEKADKAAATKKTEK